MSQSEYCEFKFVLHSLKYLLYEYYDTMFSNDHAQNLEDSEQKAVVRW